MDRCRRAEDRHWGGAGLDYDFLPGADTDQQACNVADGLSFRDVGGGDIENDTASEERIAPLLRTIV